MQLSKLVVTFLTVSVLGAGLAWAKEERRGKHKGDEVHSFEKHFNPKRLKDLNLTDEQKEKLKAIRSEARTDIKKCRADMKEARKEFKDALKSNASKEVVAAAFQKMTDKKNELSKSRLESILEVRDVLNAEQRAKIFDRDVED